MKTASRFLLCLLIALLFGISSIDANVAFHRPIHVVQPDGSQLVVYLCGDEYYHFFLTQDKVVVCPDAGRHFYYARRNEHNQWEASPFLAHEEGERTEAERAMVRAQIAEQQSVTPSLIRRERMHADGKSLLRNAQATPSKVIKGDWNCLVLLVQTSDVPFSRDDINDYFKRQFNESGFSDNGNHGSVRDYFIAQSDSLFKPSFDVHGPYTLKKTMEYYGKNGPDDNDLHAHEMIEEACRLADADVNYRRFDNDGDGSVDFICVIYAGEGESFTGVENQVWPHSSTLNDVKFDGVRMRKYAAAQELVSIDGVLSTGGIGTMCHEYSHVLGLMDAYDVDYTGNYGLQSWSLMASGNHLDNGLSPCNYTAFEKESLGWTSIETVSSESSLILKPLSEGGKAYRIVNEDNPDEYYLLENRQRQGWDSALPGHGMLVMHIDYDVAYWSSNKVNSHLPQGMTIVPADNEFGLSLRSLAGDPYPGVSGNTELTDYSLPSAWMHTDGFLHKPLTDIQEKDGIITLNVMKGSDAAPTAKNASKLNPYSFTASWSMVFGSSDYVLEVFHILNVPEDQVPDVALWNTNGVLQNILHVSSNNTVVSCLEAGEWYAYRVRSIKQGNMSAYSNMVFVRLPEEEVALSAPEALHVDSLWNEGVRLAWPPVEEADSYVLEVRRMEDSELFPDPVPQTLLFETFQRMGEAEDMDVSRVLDIYTDTLGWEGQRVFGCTDGCALLASGDGEDGRAFLNTPYLAQSEGSIYFFFSIRKYSEQDRNTEVLVCVGDDTDSEYYVAVYTLPLVSAEWQNCYFKISPLNTNTYVTFLVPSGMKACVDNVLTLFMEEDEEIDYALSRYHKMEALNREVAPADTQTLSQRFSYIPTEDTGMVFDNLSSATYRFRIRSVKDEMYSPYSEYLDLPMGNTIFMLDGNRYQYISYEAGTVSMLRNPLKEYSGDVVIPQYVVMNGDSLEVKTLADDLFKACYGLRSVSIPPSISMVGDNLFRGCRNLCYVDWQSSVSVPLNSFVGANSNCLLYVPGETMVHDTLVQVVRDAHIGRLQLSPLSDFCAPYPFFADTAIYVRRMDQNTHPGVSAGWEAITLPFDVDKIRLNGVDLHPFDESSQGPSFWLAQLGDRGFVPASSIKANIPYILSLPNSELYPETDRLNGVVSFRATHVQVEATSQRHSLSSGAFTMTPVYEWADNLSTDYVLNVYDAGIASYYPGSVFSPGRMRAEPFSAVLHPSSKAPSVYPIAFSSPSSISSSVFYQDGVPCFYSDASIQIPLFSLDGRLIRLVHALPGLNRIESLLPGTYLFSHSLIVIP